MSSLLRCIVKIEVVDPNNDEPRWIVSVTDHYSRPRVWDSQNEVVINNEVMPHDSLTLGKAIWEIINRRTNATPTRIP